jgi:hypothetical protein
VRPGHGAAGSFRLNRVRSERSVRGSRGAGPGSEGPKSGSCNAFGKCSNPGATRSVKQAISSRMRGSQILEELRGISLFECDPYSHHAPPPAFGISVEAPWHAHGKNMRDKSHESVMRLGNVRHESRFEGPQIGDMGIGHLRRSSKAPDLCGKMAANKMLVGIRPPGVWWRLRVSARPVRCVPGRARLRGQ